jgi:hypothetical protein
MIVEVVSRPSIGLKLLKPLIVYPELFNESIMKGEQFMVNGDRLAHDLSDREFPETPHTSCALSRIYLFEAGGSMKEGIVE